MKLYVKGVRLSFTASLFEAKQVQGQGKEKFSVSSIIEADTVACFGEFNPDSVNGQQKGLKWGPAKEVFSQAIMWAAGRQTKWKGKEVEVVTQLKAADRLFVHDGDAKADTPGYKGNLFINSSNEIQPQVVDEKGDKILATSGTIYPGVYATVILEPWAQDNQFGKRVNASLLGVQFLRKGERLAGGSVATADDYAPLPAGAVEAAATSGGGAASLF